MRGKYDTIIITNPSKTRGVNIDERKKLSFRIKLLIEHPRKDLLLAENMNEVFLKKK